MIQVTLEQVEALIEKEEYVKLGCKTACVVLTLVNGFEVVGTSACVDWAAYDEEIGKKSARAKALDKVWEVAGYKAQADQYEVDQGMADVDECPESISFDDDDIPF